MADQDLDAVERELQRDLEIIRQYKELLARRSAQNAAKAQPHEPAQRVLAPSRPRPARRGRVGNGSLIGLAEAMLVDEWQPVRFYVTRVRSVNPKASRAAVATALARLAENGRAQKGGNAKDGVRYRKPQKNETP